jgi:hypothetical protein
MSQQQQTCPKGAISSIIMYAIFCLHLIIAHVLYLFFSLRKGQTLETSELNVRFTFCLADCLSLF